MPVCFSIEFTRFRIRDACSVERASTRATQLSRLTGMHCAIGVPIGSKPRIQIRRIRLDQKHQASAIRPHTPLRLGITRTPADEHSGDNAAPNQELVLNAPRATNCHPDRGDPTFFLRLRTCEDVGRRCGGTSLRSLA